MASTKGIQGMLTKFISCPPQMASLKLISFTNLSRAWFLYLLGGIYLELDSIVLNSFDALRNYTAAKGAPRPKYLANSILIREPNNLFHWLHYLIYYMYNPRKIIETSVRLSMVLARKYPDYIYVGYALLARPNVAERIYFIQDGWLWNWSKHYCNHLSVRCVLFNFPFIT